MHRFLATRVGRAVLGTVLAMAVAVGPAAASIALAEQANVFDGTYLSGSSTYFPYGSSNADLSGIGWDNRISSLRTTTVVGHGFVFWTGPSYTDFSWKVCGSATWNTLPTGFNNAITSYKSTTLCPQ